MFLDLESRPQPERDPAAGTHDLRSEPPANLRLNRGDQVISDKDDPAAATGEASLSNLRFVDHDAAAGPSNGAAAPQAQQHGPGRPLEQPPIVFFFRKNGVYEKYCQQLCDKLDRQGMSARMITFPVGTTPDLIQAEVRRIGATLKDSVIFADETVKKCMDEGAFPGLSPHSLNHIFSSGCLQIVCSELDIEGSLYNVGELHDTTAQYLHRHRPRFEAIMHAALQRKPPDFIVIDVRAIRQDPPFYVFGMDGSAEQVLREDLETVRPTEGGVYLPQDQYRVSPGPDAEAAVMLREWAVAAGFSRDKIFLTDDISGLDPGLFVEAKHIWFIQDHHFETAKALREIADLRAGIETLRLDNLLAETLGDGDSDAADEGMESLPDENTLARDVVDGDDGLDDPSEIDEIEFPESTLRDEEENDREAAVRARLEDLQARVQSQKPLTTTYLPLGLDFLALTMIEEHILPAEHFGKGRALVRLALDSITDDVRRSTSRLIAAQLSSRL